MRGTALSGRFALMSSSTDYFVSRKKPRASPEVLDADMTRGDIVDTLKRLRFDHGLHCTVTLDSAVRDYLVAALARRKV
jgi:hypothetical protein